MNKPRLWKGILVLVLVFLAGGVVGSMVTSYLVKQAFARAFDFNRWPDGLVQVLDDEMILSADQKVRIRAIGETFAKRMKNTLDGAIADSGRIIVDNQHEIDQVLTPEQRAIHARMKEEFRKHLQDRLGVTLPDE